MPFFYYLRIGNSLAEFTKPDSIFLEKFRKKSMEMIMFNVREGGQAIIVRNKKKAILIDGGGGHDVHNKDLGDKLRAYLTQNKSKLISILLTHNHEEHLNAIASMLQIKDDKTVQDISEFVSPDCKFFSNGEKRTCKFYTEMINTVTTSGITHKPIGKNKHITFSGFRKNKKISLFSGPDSSRGKHYRSIMMVLPFGGAKFLFTGDVYHPYERKLIKKIKIKELLKNIDVLNVTHHGSAGGTAWDFVEHTEPAIFVTSSQDTDEDGNFDDDHNLDDDTKEVIEDYLFDGPSDPTVPENPRKKKKKHNFEFVYEPLFNTTWEGQIIVRTDGKQHTFGNDKGVLFEVQTQRKLKL